MYALSQSLRSDLDAAANSISFPVDVAARLALLPSQIRELALSENELKQLANELQSIVTDFESILTYSLMPILAQDPASFGFAPLSPTLTPSLLATLCQLDPKAAVSYSHYGVMLLCLSERFSEVLLALDPQARPPPSSAPSSAPGSAAAAAPPAAPGYSREVFDLLINDFGSTLLDHPPLIPVNHLLPAAAAAVAGYCRDYPYLRSRAAPQLLAQLSPSDARTACTAGWLAAGAPATLARLWRGVREPQPLGKGKGWMTPIDTTTAAQLGIDPSWLVGRPAGLLGAPPPPCLQTLPLGAAECVVGGVSVRLPVALAIVLEALRRRKQLHLAALTSCLEAEAAPAGMPRARVQEIVLSVVRAAVKAGVISVNKEFYILENLPKEKWLELSLKPFGFWSEGLLWPPALAPPAPAPAPVSRPAHERTVERARLIAHLKHVGRAIRSELPFSAPSIQWAIDNYYADEEGNEVVYAE